MRDGIDPYRKWLGIPPEEQPPNHYRLLGVPVFEQDAETISHAADQRINYVRTLAISDYADLTQRILNELAAAKVCLLNQERKAAYDAQLRARESALAPPRIAAPQRPAVSPRRPIVTDRYLPTHEPPPTRVAALRPAEFEPPPLPLMPDLPPMSGVSAARLRPLPTARRRPRRETSARPLLPWAAIAGLLVVIVLVAVVGVIAALRNRDGAAVVAPPARLETKPPFPELKPEAKAQASASKPLPPENQPPSVQIASVEPETPKAGDSLTVRLTGRDPEDDAIAFEYRIGPNEPWQIAPSGLAPIAELAAGPLTLEFRARDSGGRISEIVKRTLEVAPAVPPLAVVPFSAEQAKQHQAAWAKYLKTDVVVENKIGMKHLLIPPGKFTMGTVTGGGDNERPAHEVTLTKPVYVSDREVTVAQFQQFINDAQYLGPEKPQGWQGDFDKNKQHSPALDCPVNSVNWFDAVPFCNWLSANEGCMPAYERTDDVWRCDFASHGYRLPTEAEWEYACRSGSAGEFCYGDGEAALPQYASFAGNANGRTWPAGTRLANAWGLFDMHGNVGEWCWDWYGPYGAGPLSDPIGPMAGSTARVLRGGAFGNLTSLVRSAARNNIAPTNRNNISGFRVARTYR